MLGLRRIAGGNAEGMPEECQAFSNDELQIANRKL